MCNVIQADHLHFSETVSSVDMIVRYVMFDFTLKVILDKINVLKLKCSF